MNDASQLEIPASFVALYVAPGRTKPSATRDVIAARYEFCEDLATLLTEQAGDIKWQLQVTEDDVLERIDRGLRADGAGLEGAEATWVVTRLAELLGWAALPAG
jgi:hypothetical protein